MAAAFTGYAADGAAIWFNPAGLPLLEPRLLQGSLSLSALRRLDIEDAVVGPVSTEDFEITSSPTLPPFAVASFALGKPDAKGRTAAQIAISAFQTYNEELSGDIQVPDQLGRTNSIQFDQIDRITYFGAGIGWRALKNFLVGLTVLASNRRLSHNETISFAFGGTPSPDLPSPPNYENARQVNRNTQFDMNAWYLSFRIGLMQLIGERWRVGLMFQPPGVRVGGKADLRFELSDVDARFEPAPSESFFFEENGFDSNSPIPWELRLGASYVISRRVVVAADLQLVGPVGEGSLIENLPQIEGRMNISGALLQTSTKADFVWNVSVGTEIEVTRWLFARFGFLTDRSSAPSVSDEPTDRIQQASVDRYGFSVSVGGHKDTRGLSVGFSGLFGSGTGNGIDVREESIAAGLGFRRVPVKERIFIISIGGDVGKTAEVIGEELEREDDEQREEEEASPQSVEEQSVDKSVPLEQGTLDMSPLGAEEGQP